MGTIFLIAGAAILIYGIIKLIPGIFAALGNSAYSEGNTQKGLAYYKKAASFMGGTASNKTMYALLLMRNGNFKEAEQLLTNVILYVKAKPAEKNTAKAYRCMAYQKLDRLEEALEDAEEVFEVFKNTTTYGMLGYLRQVKGDAALALCLEAYEYNSDDRDICDNLAVSYIRTGDYDKAEEITDKLRESYPEFTEGFYHSAIVAFKKGSLNEALEYLDKTAECKRTAMTTVSKEEIETLREEIKNA